MKASALCGLGRSRALTLLPLSHIVQRKSLVRRVPRALAAWILGCDAAPGF